MRGSNSQGARAWEKSSENRSWEKRAELLLKVLYAVKSKEVWKTVEIFAKKFKGAT